MRKEKNILYISYDGLTDPLGQSQILPYLKGLSNLGYHFTILSFEKRERYQKEKAVVEHLTSESGINWIPLSFSSRPPLLSKFYDAVRMERKAIELHRLKNFDMIHCRSYIAADVGLLMKRKYGVKFFFDMRGFWADEKKDGSWNMSNPVFSQVYRYYKKREAQYLKNADAVIALTEAGKKEMKKWPSYYPGMPLEVIPTCADMEHFSLTSDAQKKNSRKELGIPEDNLVISYLGSVGTWYMLDEMLAFFKELKKVYRNAYFLFITHSDHNFIKQKINEAGLDLNTFKILQVPRSQVPAMVKASDINLSFIRPVYSKISSSPTKLGEVLSMGIPVICNSGVGDVEQIVTEADAGYILKGFTDNDFKTAVAAVPNLLQKSPEGIRNSIKSIFSLEKGIELYKQAYAKVLS